MLKHFTMPLPPFLKKYFWDIDIHDLDNKKYQPFIVERIMEYGDDKAIQWMNQNFSRDVIRKILTERRGISPRSANYWALVYNVPKNKVLCLNKRFQKKHAKTWNY